MWRSLRLLGLPLSLVFATLAACGSSSDEGGPGSSGGPSINVPPGGDGGPSAPPERRDFPLTTPSIGGYTLVDAFPGVDFSTNVAAALVWPKANGAAPFLLDRMGQVYRIANGTKTKVLDFGAKVALMTEDGALGIALHPQFGDGSGPKPYAYVWYNAKGSPNKQRLVRFTWQKDKQAFDASSETILVEEAELAHEHNGGRVAFGPDGFLYFGNGDDSNLANHQRIDRALFAGIFRIDVDMQGGAVSHAPPRQPEGGFTQNYFIPNDNPFVGVANAMEEFFALGLRNPFGFSFDRATGKLWTGDVGDTWREEINVVVKGGNYEWPYREGELLHGKTPTTIGTIQTPKYSYSHASMANLTAILGGFVYRGKELPELAGKYIYSDWPSARLWAFDEATKQRTTVMDNGFGRQPLGSAEDEQGEIYVLFLEGISKLVRAPSAPFPKRLTETKLFADVPAVASFALDPSFVPYEINSPLWSDGAKKRRFVRVPQGAKVALNDDGSLKFPAGTLFVKQFDFERRVETRVLVVGNDTTYGVSYCWNAEQTDGDLVTEPTDDGSWHYPSFGECWSCHRSENRVLGFTAKQINLKSADGKDQVARLAEANVLDPSIVTKIPKGIARPSDTSAPLEERATAYLAANCSGCHHEGASFLGGGDTWIASPGVPLDKRGLIGAPHHNDPTATALGMGNAPLIDPGKPERSFLLARLKSENQDLMMPPLGRHKVDAEGVAVIEAWIKSLGN